MGLIFEGLFALCLILLILWLLGLRGSVSQDRKAAQQRQKQEQEETERVAQEARLYRKGEKLRCLGCGHAFPGPLSDTGCPHCHLSALVILESDPKVDQTPAQTIGFRRKED